MRMLPSFVRQSCQTGNAGPERGSHWKKLSDGMGLQGISNISFAGYLRSKEIVLATEQSSYNGEPSTVPASEMLAC